MVRVTYGTLSVSLMSMTSHRTRNSSALALTLTLALALALALTTLKQLNLMNSISRLASSICYYLHNHMLLETIQWDLSNGKTPLRKYCKVYADKELSKDERETRKTPSQQVSVTLFTALGFFLLTSLFCISLFDNAV